MIVCHSTTHLGANFLALSKEPQLQVFNIYHFLLARSSKSRTGDSRKASFKGDYSSFNAIVFQLKDGKVCINFLIFYSKLTYNINKVLYRAEALRALFGKETFGTDFTLVGTSPL